MASVLIRACCMIAIIFTGWGLRKFNIFKENAFDVLATIMLKLTLPAAVICNLNGSEVPLSLLSATAAGFLFGFFYMGAGMLLKKKQGKRAQSFALVNLSGFNIGSFALPFASTFLGAQGVLAASIFDTGNAFVCLGGAYSIGGIVQGSGNANPWKLLGKNLIKSVPFVTYVTMTILCLLKISLPSPFMTYAQIIGNANSFIAMLMLGVGFKLSADRTQIKEVLKLLGVRYAISAVLAVFSFFCLPIDPIFRKTIAIICLSPIASAAPAFTGQLGNDTGLASAVNSLSVVISVILMTAAILILL